MLEPSYTAESLCDQLRMPPTKTLLRRHLASHFNALLGADVIQAKRQMLQEGAGMMVLKEHLQPDMKIKVSIATGRFFDEAFISQVLKKGFSLPRKKARTDVYMDGETNVFARVNEHQHLKSVTVAGEDCCDFTRNIHLHLFSLSNIPFRH